MPSPFGVETQIQRLRWEPPSVEQKP